jgi:hypothetical protein
MEKLRPARLAKGLPIRCKGRDRGRDFVGIMNGSGTRLIFSGGAAAWRTEVISDDALEIRSFASAAAAAA